MLPKAVESQLAAAAQPEIERVLGGGGPRTSRPTGEVGAVRTITLDGMDEVANAWSPILRSLGYRIEVKAVFCHSRPQVSFNRIPSPHAPSAPAGGKGRCELADLLVVMDHADRHTGIVDRRAVLIQAKLLKSGAIKPSGKEWIQHELLAWLPPFNFVDASYAPNARDLNSAGAVGSVSNTADYGGIDLVTKPAIWGQWLTSQSSPCFVAKADLGVFLAGMAVGGLQYGREAIVGGKDDWSSTVDELLNVTGAIPIVKRTPSVLRGNQAIAGFIVDTASHFFGDGDGGGVVGEDVEWPDGPLSTVHVIFNGQDR